MRKHILCVMFSAMTVLACRDTREHTVTNAMSSKVLRSEFVGCWALLDSIGPVDTREPGWSPPIARLDTGFAGRDYASGTRVVTRLDVQRQPLPPSTESGSAGLSTWTADLNGDSIRLTFNNGLYGSTWVLGGKRAPAIGDTVHGRRRDFSDVVPDTNQANHSAAAVRIECASPARAAAGV